MKLSIVTIIGISFVIQGCAGDLPSFKPVALTDNSAFEDDVAGIQREIRDLELWDRANHVMTISDTRCDKFFEELEKLKTNAKFSTSLINSATTGTSAILKAAGASSLAVAAVPTALGFVASAINSYEEIVLLSKFNTAVHKKWQAARDQSEAVIENIFKVGASSGNTVERQMLQSAKKIDRELYKYSRLCLRSQLILWLNQAANEGVVKPIDKENKGKTPAINGGAESLVSGVSNSRRIPGRTSIPSFVVSNK